MGLVIGLAMLVVVIWSNLIGSILPIFLFRLRLDPAVVSSPLITTTIDITGLAIYFLIAKMVIRIFACF